MIALLFSCLIGPAITVGAILFAVDIYDRWCEVQWLDAMLADAELRRSAEEARYADDEVFR